MAKNTKDRTPDHERWRKPPEEWDYPRCGAQKRQGAYGETCSFKAGWGTDHVGYGPCKFHGGNTAAHRQAAAQALADIKAKKALAALQVAPVDDPFAALARLAGQAIAWQEALAEAVNHLQDRIRYEGAGGAENLRAEVQLYERAMDRAAGILARIVQLNIEDRMAAVTEKQAALVISAIEAALAHAGVTGPQAAEARQVAARHLRALPSA